MSDLFTENQLSILLSNSKNGTEVETQVPIAYLRIPSLGYSFLLTQIDRTNNDLAVALCSYDTVFKVEQINLAELVQLAKARGDNLIPRLDYKAKHPLSVYKAVSEAFYAPLFDDDNEIFREYFSRIFPKNSL